MFEDNEYSRELRYFYSKSLILESTPEFDEVLYFYFKDTLAHIDFTLNLLAYNYQSIRNIMNMEYMRWRIDEEKIGDRSRFGGFINWMKKEHNDAFLSLPELWRVIYDNDHQASYRSFRIAIDPNSTSPLPVGDFRRWIDEFFDRQFLGTMYGTGKYGKLFNEYLSSL